MKDWEFILVLIICFLITFSAYDSGKRSVDVQCPKVNKITYCPNEEFQIKWAEESRLQQKIFGWYKDTEYNPNCTEMFMDCYVNGTSFNLTKYVSDTNNYSFIYDKNNHLYNNIW